MDESKKTQKAEGPRRKLSLHRETLRSLQEVEPQQLEGVVGGLTTVIVIRTGENTQPSRITIFGCF